ncbi:MAG: sigma-54-dependent Fis family transcriptional regulator [Lentisphaeria bacterium]|nr:sigma-54 dependent transcriptional regulator [Lentisphaeria bacterium]NQZ69352.1 sigma-54-dependent Fis family transcriptional regulator [Lentisphaeria bacterium]
MSARILIVDDEPAINHAMTTLLKREGFEVDSTNNGQDALAFINSKQYSLVISDIVMEGMDGIELLEESKKMHPELSFLMMTAYGSIENALKAMKLGAFDFITKPFKLDELIKTVQRALAFHDATGQNKTESSLEIHYHFRQLVGESAHMKQIYQLLENLKESEQSIMIIGEPGVGKSLLARVIHLESRADHQMIHIDCFKAEHELLDLLFNFYGLEKAMNGTVFLKDIDKMPLFVQDKLYHYLIQNPKSMIDGNRVPLNIRIVASCQTDLLDKVREGTFDENLYYCLAATEIDLPALRDRMDDLPQLIQHFMQLFENEFHRVPIIDLQVLQALEAWDWPGNITELKNVLYKAVKDSHDRLELKHLPAEMREVTTKGSKDGHRWENLKAFLKKKESEYIKELMKLNNNDIEQTAGVLKISVEALQRKLEN